MRGTELLNKMELIAPEYVESADADSTKRKNLRLIYAVATACACIVICASAVIFYINRSNANPIILSDKTTAKVSVGYEKGTSNKNEGKWTMVPMTEEKIFSRENMYIFRGTVITLTDITIDFNGYKKGGCIATISVKKVYKGNIKEGEQIKMLLQCATILENGDNENSQLISRLKTGTEGIFMPYTYNDTSRIENNGATLMLKDLASCGIPNMMSLMFLSTDQGIFYSEREYPGVQNSDNLDAIEEYVIKALKKSEKDK